MLKYLNKRHGKAQMSTRAPCSVHTQSRGLLPDPNPRVPKYCPVSGRVRALNLTVPLGSGRVGSDNLGYGPGSGFSFEPVQTSNAESRVS